MRRFKLLLVLLSFVVFVAPGQAQKVDCQFGSEDAAERLIQALTNEPSCSKAAELLEQCRWGSSADPQFAAIVINKCEKAFLPKLTPAGKARYRDENYLCAYEYAKQDGTLYVSESALCTVYVAARFATNPQVARKPAPRASFDCARAASQLEKAICTDKKLGQADIVLGRAYKAVLNSTLSTDRPKMIRLEKQWLHETLKKCKVGLQPLSNSERDCARNEFELRFRDLDACGVAGPEECMNQMQSIR